MKVIIPLKTNSERVLNKNLRQFFNNESLFDIKSKQLLKVFSPNDIFVSSENISVKKECEKYGFNFHLRDIKYTSRNIIETDLVNNLLSYLDDKESDIMFCYVTQPLFDEFDKLLQCYNNLSPEYDSICVVKKLKHHIINQNCIPINFNFGYWHKISQDLPSFYQIAWSAFIVRRETLNKSFYQIGRNPFLYEMNNYCVDIDTESDFKLAQIIYRETMG